MRTRLTTRSAAVLVTPVLAAVLALGACGDDDSAATSDSTDAPAASVATTTSPDGDTETFCAKSLEIGKATAGPPVEEGDIEVGKALAATILPIGRDLLAAGPAAVKPELELMVAAAEGAADTGDLSVFETPEFGAADAKVHAAALDACGWAVQNVELEEYKFVGLPDSLPAGVTSFEVTNNGKEMHEIAVLRKNDGVTESFEELLHLPEEEVLTKVAPMGVGFAAPGVPGYTVADLSPGEYLAICFLPVGLLPDGPPPAVYTPHFTQGMQHPFTVS